MDDCIKKQTNTIRERVQKREFQKVYTLGEISKWIQWGLKKGIINNKRDSESIKGIIKWIDLLGKNRFVDL
ncbi:hypothetical protein LVD13_12200 [Flavobacteriaceae bacterium D16]|nr:hypothetical protein [Flavobacteriaceae bacterium D16]